jgi:hypothetical protein
LPKVARKVGSVVRDLQNTSQTFIRAMERAGEIDNPFSPSAWTGQDPSAAGSANHDDAFRDPVAHERVEPRGAPEPFVHEPAAHAVAYEQATLLGAAAEPLAKGPSPKKPAGRTAKKPAAGASPAGGSVAGEPAASGLVLRKAAAAGSLFGDSPAQAPLAKEPLAKPGAKKPGVKEPVAKEPVAKKPVAKKPVAKKPVAK